MTRRTRTWQAVAGLFILINAAGAVAAAVQGELLHAGAHVVALALVGVYYTRRFWAPRRLEPALAAGPLDDRLSSLEQSIDAVAIEVERIGEGQRFMTQVLIKEPVKPPRDPADSD
jgi:hypothetical protein